MQVKKILLLLFIFFSYTAFAQDASQLIVGTWKFDMETYEKSLRQLKLPSTMTKSMIKKSKKVRFIFNADGTIQRVVEKGSNPDETTTLADGTWKARKNGEIILNRKSKNQKGKVIRISKDRLTIDNLKLPATSSMKLMDLVRVK